MDDGTYAACRLLEIVSGAADANQMLDALPTSFSTPELNVACAEGEPPALMRKAVALADFGSDQLFSEGVLGHATAVRWGEAAGGGTAVGAAAWGIARQRSLWPTTGPQSFLIAVEGFFWGRSSEIPGAVRPNSSVELPSRATGHPPDRNLTGGNRLGKPASTPEELSLLIGRLRGDPATLGRGK